MRKLIIYKQNSVYAYKIQKKTHHKGIKLNNYTLIQNFICIANRLR